MANLGSRANLTAFANLRNPPFDEYPRHPHPRPEQSLTVASTPGVWRTWGSIRLLSPLAARFPADRDEKVRVEGGEICLRRHFVDAASYLSG